MRLVECVPNFSEGNDKRVIDAIAFAISAVDNVELLDVDPGKATNRTVMTFVGEPEAAMEAAFQAIKCAAEHIDMASHKGEHPRMGATDVCPFIPVSGVSMEDCAELARRLGRRVGDELGIPVYLYGEAASVPERRNLADIRQGEYEGLPEKMRDPSFKPDFGACEFNAKAGATVIGARKFLIAYNVNLNTRSKQLASEIALTIRDKGRSKKDASGAIVRDKDGKAVIEPGTLAACKAVGWYIEEYKRAQVSINLVDFETTSVHTAFDEVVRQAESLGLRVTGSEVVGMIPLAPLVAAGKHYLARQGLSTGVPESDIIECAVQSLGLSDIAPFIPEEKIIEYRVAPKGKLLTKMSVSDFADEVSSSSPAPGGGSVAALCGSLSASLVAMVANLTHGKKGFEEIKSVMDDLAGRAQSLKAEFLRKVDEDANAFNQIVAARRMPKDSDEASRKRDLAILAASKVATLVPLSVLKASLAALELTDLVVEKGNPASLSDGGVAGLTAGACAEAAYYNVLINLGGIDDAEFTQKTREEADLLVKDARSRAEAIHRKLVCRL